MTTEEEAAWAARDYERAASFKSERLQSETEFNAKRDAWRQEMNLDEIVDEEDIAQVVASWTGIPVHSLMETEAAKLLQMEERLHERMVGQDEAVNAVADAIRRARSGLKDPKRPIGSFIFLGPSGVGKTELGKTLAWFMFDDEEALVRIDMSEYRERHTVSRLFGAPPGYVGYEEGGQLTEAVRRRPYQIVLFDEIEKEDGRLTDGQGHVVDFRNTVIIMTSNIGTEFAQKGATLGFLRPGETDTSDEQEAHQKIQKDLKKTFRPEFLNRVDEIIIFHTLAPEQVKQIVDLQMEEISARLAERGLTVELTVAAREWLAEEGYDPQFGARPLKRTLQRHVESPLSVQLLNGVFQSGDTVVIDVGEEGLAFAKKGVPIAEAVFAKEEALVEQEA